MSLLANGYRRFDQKAAVELARGSRCFHCSPQGFKIVNMIYYYFKLLHIENTQKYVIAQKQNCRL